MRVFGTVKGVVALAAVLVIAAACPRDEPTPPAADDGADEGVILFGADGLLSDTFIAEPESTGMYFSGPGVRDSSAYEEFVAAYEEEYGEAPIAGFHAHAYDAANILFDAIEQVAQVDGDSMTVGRQDLRDALYDLEGHEGLSGTVTCDAFGDCADPFIEIFRKTEDGQSLGEVTGESLFTFEPEEGIHAEGEPEAAEPAEGEVTIAGGDPVVVGTMQVISGDAASLGTDQVRAIELAIADRGDINGHEIELLVEDEECAAEGGQAAAEALVSDPQLIGAIGTSCSGAGVPAAEVISGAGAVLISGSNTSPSLTSVGGEQGDAWQPGYYRTAHNDEVQGRAAATFAIEELGVQTAASIHDGDPYTQGLTGVFDEVFVELGGNLALATAVNKGDTDMRPVLTEVQAAGAEVIFFPIFEPEGNFIAQQAPEIFGEVAGQG